MKKLLAACSLLLAGFAASAAEAPALAAGDFFFHRAHIRKDTGFAMLPPEGIMLSKTAAGAGTYTVTFAVDSSDPKFQFHQPYFIFNVRPEAKSVEALKAVYKDGDYLVVVWRESGQVEFLHHRPGQKNEKLGIYLQPGPEKENAYKPDVFATMRLVVPDAPGKELKVYFNKPAAGEADCEFVMPDGLGIGGRYGFLNPKWFSKINIKALSFTPAAG